jgi:hypothetical protein
VICHFYGKNLQIFSVILVFISGQVLQNTPSLLVKCDSQLTADVTPYNNRNDGGPAAGRSEKLVIFQMSRAFRIISTVNIYTIPKTIYEIFRFFRFLIKQLLLFLLKILIGALICLLIFIRSIVLEEYLSMIEMPGKFFFISLPSPLVVNHSVPL